MDWLIGFDWQTMFVPSTSLLEIVVRGTLMYLGIFALMRVVLKRESGGVGITDMLVVVLIADAASSGMSGDYTSIPEGLLLVGVILAWSGLLNRLGHRFPAIQRLIHPGPLLLIRDGEMLPKNMAKESLTEGELMEKLRLQGVEDVGRVGRAYMESDGQVSVVRIDEQAPEQTSEREN